MKRAWPILVKLVAEMEVEFTTAARELSPLEDWIGSPQWFWPAREQETAPAG